MRYRARNRYGASGIDLHCRRHSGEAGSNHSVAAEIERVCIHGRQKLTARGVWIYQLALNIAPLRRLTVVRVVFVLIARNRVGVAYLAVCRYGEALFRACHAAAGVVV